MATNERVEALLDTLQDRVDEQGRVIEALERRLTVLSNENNATYNEKLEHRIISGLLQRTSTLEDRVADLSNENNATYQAHHRIARAQNVIIDVLGFTLRMLNPQHIDNRTLEDLRERLDGARLPQEAQYGEPKLVGSNNHSDICSDAKRRQEEVTVDAQLEALHR